MRSGRVDRLDVAPQAVATVALNWGKTDDEGEWLLNVRYVQKERENLVPAGYAVAKMQLPLTAYNAPELAIENVTDKNVETTTAVIDTANVNCIVVDGDNFSLEFNKKTGYMDRYTVGGVDMIKDGGALTPNFWRAPTDNDFGANLQKNLPYGRIRKSHC